MIWIFLFLLYLHPCLIPKLSITLFQVGCVKQQYVDVYVVVICVMSHASTLYFCVCAGKVRGWAMYFLTWLLRKIWWLSLFVGGKKSHNSVILGCSESWADVFLYDPVYRFFLGPPVTKQNNPRNLLIIKARP